MPFFRLVSLVASVSESERTCASLHTQYALTISVLMCINIVYITLLQIMCASGARYLFFFFIPSHAVLFFYSAVLGLLCFCQFQFFVLIKTVGLNVSSVFFFILFFCIGPILLNHVVYRLFYLYNAKLNLSLVFALTTDSSSNNISSIDVGI